jgi:hypothetical protein
MRKSEYPDAISMDFTFYCEQVQLDFVAIDMDTIKVRWSGPRTSKNQ